MNKIDCTKTENYLKEKYRMCGTFRCYDCDFRKDNIDCKEFQRKNILRAIDIVQKWSDEHPLKTRFDDFKEKMPKANFDYIHANVSPSLFGYCKNCTPCRIGLKTPSRCWDEPIDGGATGDKYNS